MPGFGGGGAGGGDGSAIAQGVGMIYDQYQKNKLGTGPLPSYYQPSRSGIDFYNHVARRDLKAYRQGGIDDPRLEHLGFGPNWKAKEAATLRDETAGEELGAEQGLRGAFSEYGAPPVSSGYYMQNLLRLRAGRTRAMDASMRDLELENYRQKMSALQGEMQFAGNRADSLTGQYNDAEYRAYLAALERYRNQTGFYQDQKGGIASALSQMNFGGGGGAGGGGGYRGFGGGGAGGTSSAGIGGGGRTAVM